MGNESDQAGYRIWAIDDVVYGPIELPVLAEWLREQRISPGTWVFAAKRDAWHKAGELPELRAFIEAKPASQTPASEASYAPLVPGIKPGMLRRAKILADMTDQQLGQFVQSTEVQKVSQWTEIVRQGTTGDAMFVVLEGEVRVRLMIDGKETILVTLSAGDFFGEIALFDPGPRAADVVANQDSVLLRISVRAFQQLAAKAPSTATLFLTAICKSLATRFRADDKRIREAISFTRTTLRAF